MAFVELQHCERAMFVDFIHANLCPLHIVFEQDEGPEFASLTVSLHCVNLFDLALPVL